MRKRDPLITLILMSVTCGLYALYYTYETTKELAEVMPDAKLNVATETALNLFTCGVFGMYAEYRNQQLIDAWYVQHGLSHEPKAQTVGLMNLAGWVVGVTWFVAVYIHIDELNKLAGHLSPEAPSTQPTTF